MDRAREPSPCRRRAQSRESGRRPVRWATRWWSLRAAIGTRLPGPLRKGGGPSRCRSVPSRGQSQPRCVAIAREPRGAWKGLPGGPGSAALPEPAEADCRAEEMARKAGEPDQPERRGSGWSRGFALSGKPRRATPRAAGAMQQEEGMKPRARAGKRRRTAARVRRENRCFIAGLRAKLNGVPLENPHNRIRPVSDPASPLSSSEGDLRNPIESTVRNTHFSGYGISVRL